MSKVKDNIITIKAAVSLNGKDINSELKLSLSDIQKLLDAKGPQAVNQAIGQITQALHTKVNDSIRDLLNEPL